jgi:ATP-dependent Lon protease
MSAREDPMLHSAPRRLFAPDASSGTQSGDSADPSLPPDALAILPVRDSVLFPGAVMPLAVGRQSSVAAVQYAMRAGQQIGVVMQRDPQAAEPSALDLHRMGTIANILRWVTAPDGSHHLISQGVQRFRVVDYVMERPLLAARVLRIEEPETRTQEIEARFLHLKNQALEALQLMPQVPEGLVGTVQNLDSPSALADLVSVYLDIRPDEKQEILETIDLTARLDRVSRVLARRLEVLRLSEEIGRQTRASLDQRQREVLLREQMAAIQRQLGEEDGKSAEIKELTEAIAKAGMPPEVEEAARKELRRLERMSEASPEHGMIRSYLDWLIELPWRLPDEKPIDIAEARRILDEDHFGLDRIKRRIVEYLAVRKLAPQGKAPILCFVGPPGVGKTSLGQSIARAMGRKFVRVSLGGVHDEAEIRGHRRTYIGALPGNIIQAIRKAGTRDCVMMLDEIDKLGRGIQ